MIKRASAFVALIVLAFSALAEWDKSALVGQWESYKHEYMHNYQKLEINEDFTGTFTYAMGSTPPAIASFEKKDFEFFEGFAVLTVDQGLKFVLSAWGLPEGLNGKMLLGQSFIYVVEGEEISLINAEPVRFLPAGESGISTFLQNTEKHSGKTSP